MTSPTEAERPLRAADCPQCQVSRANAKAAGHRDWRAGVCGDCAWLDMDGPEVRALMANVTEDMIATQPAPNQKEPTSYE